jgi:hypothetical protein
MIKARICKQEDFETLWFKHYTRQINYEVRYHRKLWENISIIDTLHDLKLLKKGKKGLGFAVGTEPLTSYFVKQGCQITATDLVVENDKWAKNNEQAKSLESLNVHHIIDDELLYKKAQFLNVDMNNIPDNLLRGKYDFLWSSCAFEHLGSIQKGIDFILNSIDCLKLGGYALHTTELNCSSEEDTVMYGDSVLFRKSDFYLMEKLLGDRVEFFPIDFSNGTKEYDLYVDRPPYEQKIHLKLELFGFITTSVLLIIKRIK